MDVKDQGAQMEPLLPAVRTSFIFHVGFIRKTMKTWCCCVLRKRGFGGSSCTGLESPLWPSFTHHHWKTLCF